MSQIVCFGANIDGITVKASDSFLFNANLKYLFTAKSVFMCKDWGLCVCVQFVCNAVQTQQLCKVNNSFP